MLTQMIVTYTYASAGEGRLNGRVSMRGGELEKVTGGSSRGRCDSPRGRGQVVVARQGAVVDSGGVEYCT